jgi:SOS-response transcriptional repressor LexA
MAHIGPVVRKLRKEAGWSIQRLATLAEVDPGYLSRIEREEAGYTPATEDKLARSLGVSVAGLHSESETLIGMAVASKRHRRIPILTYGQAQVAELMDGYPAWMLDAGTVTELEHSSATFAVRVADNMMIPTFTEGDLVIIDPSIPPRAGDYVVALNGDGIPVFNRYRVAGSDADGEAIFELIPLNQYYPTWRSDNPNGRPLKVLGVMVEHRIPRRV